jgi:8-amino-7-oxononanoate synthase
MHDLDEHTSTQVITATLSKAFASQGGAILGSRAVIDHVIDQARPFIFDTALAPTSVAAAHEALRIMRSVPDLPRRALANARHLSSLANAVGLQASAPEAAVVSIRIGRPQDALAAQQICLDHGVLVGCFRPPSVPDADSRLRLTARADLDEPALATVGAALAAVAAFLDARSRGR